MGVDRFPALRVSSVTVESGWGRPQQMRTDRIARVLPVWEGLFSLAELFSMLGT